MDPVRESLWRLGGGPRLLCLYAERGEPGAVTIPPNWPHLVGRARKVVLCALTRDGKRGRWQVVEVHGPEGADEYLRHLQDAGVPLERARGRQRKRVLRAEAGHIICETSWYSERGSQIYDPDNVVVTFNGTPVVPARAAHVAMTVTMAAPITSLTVNGVVKL